MALACRSGYGGGDGNVVLWLSLLKTGTLGEQSSLQACAAIVPAVSPSSRSMLLFVSLAVLARVRLPLPL